MQSKIFSRNKTLKLGNQLLDLSVPRVMGILNVTPDSFFDGQRFTDEASMLKQAEKMIHEGVDIIDIGGYSTRPGAEEIAIEEELNRVLPAITSVAKHFPSMPISVDTFRASVATQAIGQGAVMINDISGGEMDSKMFTTVASLGVPYVLMHSRGTPQTMASLTEYANLEQEIIQYFHQKIVALHELEVRDIIVDPGFGFAKTVEQNFHLLNRLNLFEILGKPIMAGLSRKSLIWRTLHTKPEGALTGTIALNTVAILKGASLLRVHDVLAAKETIDLLKQLA